MHKVLICFLLIIYTLSSPSVFSKEPLFLFIHKPPANIRLTPQGKLYCEFTEVMFIKTSTPALDYKKNKWYPIKACEENGFIHQSEVIAFSTVDDLTVRQLTSLSKKGHKYAQYNLGLRYKEGSGVKKNSKKALKWLKKSAKQGSANAQYELAIMYKKGEGVRENKKKAKELFEQSAKNGNEFAIYQITELSELEEKNNYIKKGHRINSVDLEKYPVFVKKAPSFLRNSPNGDVICVLKDNTFVGHRKNYKNGWHEIYESCGDEKFTTIHESQIKILNDEFRSDKELAKELLSQKGGYLKYFSDDIRSDKEIVMIAVKSEGTSIRYANKILKTDRLLALRAVRSNPFALLDIDPRLKKDDSFINEAFEGIDKKEYMFLVNSIHAKSAGYKDNITDNVPSLENKNLVFKGLDKEEYMSLVDTADAEPERFRDKISDEYKLGDRFIEIMSSDSKVASESAILVFKMKFSEVFRKDVAKDINKKLHLVKIKKEYKAVMESDSWQEAKTYFNLFNDKFKFNDVKVVINN